MRYLATVLRSDRPALRSVRRAILIAAVGAGAALSPAAMAQEATPPVTPSASPAATPEAAQAPVESTVLMQAAFDEFVPAPLTVRMLRITLAPGASVPMHTHPGPEFDRIESGTLTVRAEGEATVTRASGDTETVGGDGTTLSPGDWILYPPEVGMAFQNQGDEDVVILSAVLLPVGADFPETITYTEGEPTSADFEGVSFTVLGDGLVQELPAGPATVTIESLVVPPGTDLPAAEGVAMYSHVNGNFSFVVDSGAVQVSRSELQSLQPNAIPGEEFSLEAGDAAFFPAGVTPTSRSGEAEPLEILRLTLVPETALEGEPATLTWTAGEEVAGDATGGAEAPGSEATGAIAAISSDGVNLRAEPTISADVVDQLSTGVEVEIIGGPQEADGYTWYQVRVTAEGGAEGWVAADFLEGDFAASETPAAGEEPAEGTPAAQPAPFATGDTVVTTDENVRLRADASAGAEIINAYPTGTAFVVTGEPQEADGYTWYPVALADDESITGWIASDFLAPAEGGE